jgi:hypothetical protein
MGKIDTFRGYFSRFHRYFITLFLIFAIVLPSTAFAATGQSVGSSAGASGLSVSPLEQKFTLSPGKFGQIIVNLKNVTSGPIIAIPTVRSFTANGVNGNPKILSTNQNNPASINNFLINLTDIKLNPGQEKTFSVVIHVPNNATPGAYYGLIEYQAKPDNNLVSTKNTQVALTAAVSQLVFITVPGNITQIMQVKAINVYQDSKGTTPPGIFFTSPPKSIGINLDNLANALEQPYGTLQIQGFGGKVIGNYQVNNGITRGLVLPYSTRIFINQIKKVTSPGPYTVIASITYGSKGSSILVAKKTFWYIPAWLIIALLVIVIFLIALVIYFYQRYRNGRVSQYRR